MLLLGLTVRDGTHFLVGNISYVHPRHPTKEYPGRHQRWLRHRQFPRGNNARRNTRRQSQPPPRSRQAPHPLRLPRRPLRSFWACRRTHHYPSFPLRGNPVGEEQGGESSPPSMSVSVSYLDIINYEIAHLIRSETAEGHIVVKFLVEIMTGRDRPFTPKKFRIKPADRMAAARELLQSRLRRLRLQAQTVRQQRRSKRLRHPAHRPRQANARIQRARRRHHPLPP